MSLEKPQEQTFETTLSCFYPDGRRINLDEISDNGVIRCYSKIAGISPDQTRLDIKVNGSQKIVEAALDSLGLDRIKGK